MNNDKQIILNGKNEEKQWTRQKNDRAMEKGNNKSNNKKSYDGKEEESGWWIILLFRIRLGIKFDFHKIKINSIRQSI